MGVATCVVLLVWHKVPFFIWGGKEIDYPAWLTLWMLGSGLWDSVSSFTKAREQKIFQKAVIVAALGLFMLALGVVASGKIG